MTYNVELTGAELHELIVVLEMKASQYADNAEAWADECPVLAKMEAMDAAKYEEIVKKLKEVWHR